MTDSNQTALTSADREYCPTVKSQSVSFHDNCLFCPTVVRHNLVVNQSLKYFEEISLYSLFPYSLFPYLLFPYSLFPNVNPENYLTF